MERPRRALPKTVSPALLLSLLGPLACVGLDKPASVANIDNPIIDAGKAESGQISPDVALAADTVAPIDQAISSMDAAAKPEPDARDASIDSSTRADEAGGPADASIDAPLATPDAAPLGLTGRARNLTTMRL